MNLLDLKLMDLGPQVAIIDDREEDAIPIEIAFNELSIGNKFFKVDFAEPNYPKNPLQNVEIVFLDLYYNEGYGYNFDPFLCINWLEKVVPKGRKYVLVIWSRDTVHTEELLNEMQTLDMAVPYFTDTKPKNEYRNTDNSYDIKRLLEELTKKLDEFNVKTEEFYGKILEIEESNVLVNCLISEEPSCFEIRRFSIDPFKDYIDLEEGRFVHIKIITKPGSIAIDFSNELSDLSSKFIKVDMENLGDLSWLNTPE